MAPMRQQPITDESWTEAEAMRLVRGLSDRQRRAWSTRNGLAPVSDGSGKQDGEMRRAALTRTVEDEVIPRLLMARRPQKIARAVAEISRPHADQVTSLANLVLGGTQSQATAYVEAMRDSGTSTETLLLDLIAPAARELGVRWEDDTANFAEVTIGLLRLGNVLRLLSRAFSGDTDLPQAGPRVLLAQMPGEQHGLGLAMVVLFFRRAGWNVRQETAPTSADLVGIVRNDWFGLVGLSVSCSDRLESLAADIRAIRKQSRNPAIGVLVGGPPFIAHPQLAAMVGADATAIDARQAVQQAQDLISLLARER